MWKLRCCFLGSEKYASGDKTSAGSAVGTCVADASLSTPRNFGSPSATEKLPGAVNSKGATFADHQPTVDETCRPLPSGAVTVAVDVTTPVDTPCVPTRWSDWGSRPELDALLPSPFVSANHGSFSRLLQKPESLDLESNPSLGGHSSCATCPCAAGRQPTVRDLRSCTIAQLLSVVSSASWVGQGAQGAVVKAQWQSGCTVAVKWLVQDAVNLPAAFMEALVAKMLAHPFLVQAFDCAMCHLDDSFDQAAPRDVCEAAAPLSRSSAAASCPGNAVFTAGAAGAAAADARSLQLAATEPLAVAPTMDSFEGTQMPRVGPTPVDCVGVLKQLGAAPGKYVVQIISEWCDEGTLHTAIRRGVFRPQAPGPGPGRSRTWALRALLRTAREVAQGMCHLHGLNIIHGDLKPANVLLKSSRVDSRGFVAKVADFGLSRICNQREPYVTTLEWGTVPYMAGEYLDNRLYKSSDVYSFGVLVWQMYTGRAPFAGQIEAVVAVGVMMGNLQLEWPPNMPAPLRRLCQACCRHEPDQRPSFKEIVLALHGIEAQIRELAAGAKARHAAVCATHSATMQRQQLQQQQLSAPTQQLLQGPQGYGPIGPTMQLQGLLYMPSERVVGAAAAAAAAGSPLPPLHAADVGPGSAPVLSPYTYLPTSSHSNSTASHVPRFTAAAGVDAAGAAASGLMAGTPMSYYAALRSSSLERPGAEPGVVLTDTRITSALLSGCPVLQPNAATAGSGLLSYPADGDLPFVGLPPLTLSPSPSIAQQQQQQQQQQQPTQQTPSYRALGLQGPEVAAAVAAAAPPPPPQTFRVSSLPAVSDGRRDPINATADADVAAAAGVVTCPPPPLQQQQLIGSTSSRTLRCPSGSSAWSALQEGILGGGGSGGGGGGRGVHPAFGAAAAPVTATKSREDPMPYVGSGAGAGVVDPCERVAAIGVPSPVRDDPFFISNGVGGGARVTTRASMCGAGALTATTSATSVCSPASASIATAAAARSYSLVTALTSAANNAQCSSGGGGSGSLPGGNDGSAPLPSSLPAAVVGAAARSTAFKASDITSAGTDDGGVGCGGDGGGGRSSVSLAEAAGADGPLSQQVLLASSGSTADWGPRLTSTAPPSGKAPRTLESVGLYGLNYPLQYPYMFTSASQFAALPSSQCRSSSSVIVGAGCGAGLTPRSNSLGSAAAAATAAAAAALGPAPGVLPPPVPMAAAAAMCPATSLVSSETTGGIYRAPMALGLGAYAHGSAAAYAATASAGPCSSTGLRPQMLRVPYMGGVATSGTLGLASPLSLRAMSSRRGSAGPALQHVPEDDDGAAAAPTTRSDSGEGRRRVLGLAGVLPN